MSLVNSTIDDYVLASFPLPSTSSASTSRSTFVTPPPATSVQYPSAPKQDGRLVVATPGVGVSVYDLADQTPLSSITVGPSFAPSTSAVARSVPLTSSESVRVKSTRQTWVGVRTDDGKGEIWCWQEEERKDGSSEGEAGKAVWPISEPLAALAVPKTLPAHLVFLSKSGSFALAPSNDLTSLVSLPYVSAESGSDVQPVPSSQTMRLIPVSASSAPAFLPPALVALLPASSSPSQAHIALIVRTLPSSSPTSVQDAPSLAQVGKKKFKKTPRPSATAVIEAADATATSERIKNELEIVLLDPALTTEEGETKAGVVSLGKVEIEADKVVVSDDGYVTALTGTGSLSSSRLAVKSAAYESYASVFFPAPSVEPTTPSLTLSPVKSLALAPTALVPGQAALLALHSSFVLLAAPRASKENSTPVVSLTYWDARFGAVIASSELSVPSAVATSVATLSLSACLPTRNTAILTLAPSSSSTITSSSRIALFCLPLSPPLPSASVLAAIVGRQRLTSQYLAQTDSSDSVVAKAKKAEPALSATDSLPAQALEAAQASRAARESLLEALEKVLAPLKNQQNVKEADKAVHKAEKEWNSFLETERKRSWEAERPKLAKRKKDAAAAQIEEIKLRWSEGQGRNGRFKRVKRVVERAIVEGGASVDVDASAGKATWKAVLKEDIEGVDSADKQKYIEERNNVESEVARVRKAGDAPIEESQRPEPTFPSAFVTAVLRLAFPTPLDTPSTELAAGSSASTTTQSSYRHPSAIISYLIKRDLVGENQIEGGLTRYLARAGDWTNIVLALAHVSDIPESTATSLLLSVARAQTSSPGANDSMDVDSVASPVPALSTFLSAFLRQPYTPATLRQALQKQITATEALPILAICDEWLAWWLKNGTSVEEVYPSSPEAIEDKTSLVLVDPFASRVSGDEVPPSADQIVPLVQALLDAHFVTLLLQRQSHKLLRRLTSRVASHTAQLNDLSTLLGALSVFSRKNQELVQAEEAAKRQAEAKRNGVREVKKFGESMEKRAKAQEKHQEVGAYQVEEFYL
ncbi:uncharacterized protein JCM15063_003612 [Sporobolomyces koalae]|uniref:uncharacterized protein n=1 Tax=Sporobolomyces koalae TaxID=500713 RepID=UPI00316FB79E